MTVKDYLNLQHCDYDFDDKDYDAVVTCCYIDEINNSYDTFCDLLTSKVSIVKGGDYPIANWSGFIANNFEKFKTFAKENWHCSYDDDDEEFVYEWIKEFHSYLAGMVSYTFYDKLVEFFETLEPVKG